MEFIKRFFKEILKGFSIFEPEVFDFDEWENEE